METKIKNREALLAHGDVESRRLLLDVAEAALQHLDARERIRSIARMEGGRAVHRAAALGPL